MGQAAQVTTVVTTPASDVAPVQVYLVGDDDYVIPLVFPDYKIHIDGYQTDTENCSVEEVKELLKAGDAIKGIDVTN